MKKSASSKSAGSEDLGLSVGAWMRRHKTEMTRTEPKGSDEEGYDYLSDLDLTKSRNLSRGSAEYFNHPKPSKTRIGARGSRSDSKGSARHGNRQGREESPNEWQKVSREVNEREAETADDLWESVHLSTRQSPRSVSKKRRNECSSPGRSSPMRRSSDFDEGDIKANKLLDDLERMMSG